MKQTVRHQTVRYVLVGGVVFACDFLTFMLVLGIDERMYLAGNIAGKALGALLGFFLHRHVTFSWEQQDGAVRQFVSYMLLLASNMLLSSGLLWIAVDRSHIYEPVAKVAVDIVTILLAFGVSRRLIYRPARLVEHGLPRQGDRDD